MKFIPSVSCGFFLIGIGSIAMAQPQPLNMEEILRKLRAETDASAETNIEAAEQELTPEELAAQQRVFELRSTLTDESIQRIPSSDLLLRMLYRHRSASTMEGKNEPSWQKVVDRDIQRRPDAKVVFQSLFRNNRGYSTRLYIMQYFDRHDVAWGGEIMEEAIQIYLADRKKWTNAEQRMLCTWIGVRGNESHLEFLDLITKDRGSDNGAANLIRRRTQAAKDKKARNSATLLSTMKKDGQHPDVDANHAVAPTPEQNLSSSCLIFLLMLLAVAGLWWLLLRRKQLGNQ